MKTIDEMCSELDGIADEYRVKAEKAPFEELELLLDVARCAEVAREKLLDTKVLIVRYVTHCLEQERQSLE